jgi:hypothetical protein
VADEAKRRKLAKRAPEAPENRRDD